jgi:hypothetical protein
MELDKEEWLAHRILRAEREPVAWDKTQVWERINEQIRPAGFRRYYIAATITLLLLLGSYFTIDDAAESVPRPDVITEGQSETPELMTEPSAVPQEVFVQKLITQGGRETKRKDVSSQNDLRDTRSNVIAMEKIPSPVDSYVDSMAMRPPIVIADTETQEAAEERIRPVIGVMYSGTSTPSMANQKRRKRFYKLEAGGTEPWSPPLSNTLILAGKK